MKQFMTLSAFFLSAACLCVHTQTFAAQSTANQVTQGAEDVVQGTVNAADNIIKGTGRAVGNVVDGTEKAAKRVGKGVRQTTKKGFITIEKGTEDLFCKKRMKSKYKKSNN